MWKFSKYQNKIESDWYATKGSVDFPIWLIWDIGSFKAFNALKSHNYFTISISWRKTNKLLFYSQLVYKHSIFTFIILFQWIGPKHFLFAYLMCHLLIVIIITVYKGWIHTLSIWKLCTLFPSLLNRCFCACRPAFIWKHFKFELIWSNSKLRKCTNEKAHEHFHSIILTKKNISAFFGCNKKKMLFVGVKYCVRMDNADNIITKWLEEKST